MKVFALTRQGFQGALALFLALALRSFAQDTSPPPGGETLKLPDFSVIGKQELPPPESWQYTRLEDGTEVLSNASERATRRLLRDFQMFKQALGIAWPALANQTAPIARTLILCGRRDKYNDFAAPASGANDMASTSRFVRNREQAAIIVDLQVKSLNLSDLDDEVAGVTRFEVDPYKQLYREYVRFLLSQGSTRPPAWLQEGISQIVMAMEFTPDWVKLGELNAGNTGPTSTGPVDVPAGSGEGGDEESAAEITVGDRPFNAVLSRRALLPMEKLFAVQPDAREATNPLGNNLWAKQAYAFVHLCLYGENGRYKAAFDEFTKRLQTEPLSEPLFKECFKMSYKEMLLTLRGYVSFTPHRTDLHKLKPDSPRFGGDPVVMREATQAEIGRIKGDAQRLAGRVHDGLASYVDAYLRGEREPMLLAAYGVAASETGQNDKALPLLETAAQASGTRRPSAYVELGRQRLIAAKAKVGPEGHLDEAQTVTVMAPLLKARAIRIPLAETYHVIADTLLASAGPIIPEYYALLGEGARLFPRESRLFLSLARLYQRNGEVAAAAKVAQLGARLATNDQDRARLEQLQASLPAPPAVK